MVIWKAQVGEKDFATTFMQCIVSGELFNKIGSWIKEIKANVAGISFKNKYFIRVTASYNYIMVCDIIPQDIYFTRHVYNFY